MPPFMLFFSFSFFSNLHFPFPFCEKDALVLETGNLTQRYGQNNGFEEAQKAARSLCTRSSEREQ
jgi:hypothetical protein